MAIRLTREEFIKKSKKIHGNKYNYSKVKYINTITPVIIICPAHGEFYQIPSTHLRGCNCPKCYGLNKTNEEFINEAKQIHGNKYDYSKVNYIGSAKKVEIICLKHGSFLQTPNVHLQGKGCPKCSKLYKTKEMFVNQAKAIFNDIYDYSHVEYKGNKTKVKIICPIHGEFYQIPSNHLKGNGCPYCSNKKTNQNMIIERFYKIHGNRYNYSKFIYENYKSNSVVICPIHGEFKISASNHLSGKGCPKCRCSHGETKIRNFLQKNNIQFEEQIRFDDCKYKRPLPFDFAIYNGDKLLYLIEYDGEQHFNAYDYFGGESRLLYVQQNDSIKTEFCKKNNISLIRITYLDDVDEVLNTIDFEQ